MDSLLKNFVTPTVNFSIKERLKQEMGGQFVLWEFTS